MKKQNKKRSATASAREIADFLNGKLDIARFPDDPSNNGLQLESSGSVGKICCGVDASPEFFEEAVKRGADMCVVHHGISWGKSLARIRGLDYRIVSFLIKHNIALYAAHLPLDAHPVLGNNAVLAKAVGLTGITPFFNYAGYTIGMKGSFKRAITPDRFAERIFAATGSSAITVMPYGKDKILTAGIVSGGAADEMPQAVEAGLDAYVTGECGLQAYNCAKGNSINAFFAGHYATETFGVKSLGTLIASKFGIQCEFIDFRLPY